MFNLIYKEFVLQKKLLIFNMGYGAFLFFAFIEPSLNKMVYGLGGMAAAYIFFMSVIASEDKNNSDIILNSLPIKRSTIVLTKYVVLILGLAISLAVMGLIGALFKTIGFPPVQRFIGFNDLVAAFSFVGILGSLYYPLYLKLGQKYIRIFNMFVFILAFAIPGIFTALVMTQKSQLFMDFLKLIKNTPETVFIVGGLIVTLLSLVASILISIRIYQNKDF